jgi:hypothetical protein
MNRTIKLLLLLALAALLAACKGSAAATTAQAATQGVDEMRLILGTLQLREGDLAVDAAQAAELLPLWKAYRALAQSDATSDAERAALLKQVREAMRPDQLAAIDALAMGAENQAALAAEMGLEMPDRGMGDLSQDEIAARMAERGIDPAAMAAGGDFGGGGMMAPGGGGGAAAGAMMAPGGGGAPGGGVVVFGQGGQQAAAGGGAATRAGATSRANMLLEALIAYLEEIA